MKRHLILLPYLLCAICKFSVSLHLNKTMTQQRTQNTALRFHKVV